jgi:hypothetical protein
VVKMKILLVDPRDVADSAPWSEGHWDRIIDLGLGGENTYARWNAKFDCSVQRLSSFRQPSDFRYIRGAFDAGQRSLIDEHGLDWWEVMSIHLFEDIDHVIQLRRLARSIGPDDEVHVTRPSVRTRILEHLLRGRASALVSDRASPRRGLGHYLQVCKNLSAAQLIDVFWDKFDPGHQFRGRLSRRRACSREPVVLLPSAYINVSRTGVAYANTLPEEQFLLVATRRSASIPDCPSNVDFAWLSSYASLRDRRSELAGLQAQWHALLNSLLEIEEFRILHELGVLNNFLQRIRTGLEIRDAWRNVFDREPVCAVFCADDGNPYTRIPLLLAHARGLPAVATHHGALNGEDVFKRNHGDVILAKGEMERDYLERVCGVPSEQIEIGAPAATSFVRKKWNRKDSRTSILFISEAYEVGVGRAEEFYRDVLPPLADLALDLGRRLIVKLHPVESKEERRKIVDRILSPRQKAVTRIVGGVLTEDLFSETWFAVTVLSTVATECAMRGIPCFLCRWLEFTPYGYVEQFIRFGAGFGLDSPSDFARIPESLDRYTERPGATENFWQPIRKERFQQLLAGSRVSAVAV